MYLLPPLPFYHMYSICECIEYTTCLYTHHIHTFMYLYLSIHVLCILHVYTCTCTFGSHTAEFTLTLHVHVHVSPIHFFHIFPSPSLPPHTHTHTHTHRLPWVVLPPPYRLSCPSLSLSRVPTPFTVRSTSTSKVRSTSSWSHRGPREARQVQCRLRPVKVSSHHRGTCSALYSEIVNECVCACTCTCMNLYALSTS